MLRTIIALASVVGLAAGAAPKNGVLPDHDLLPFLIRHLDVTSFPSSIGPRKTAGKVTFADYGFRPVMMNASQAVLETSPHDWRFELRVLGHTQSTVRICLHDKAMNGGTYDAQRPLLLQPAAGASLLAAKGSHPDRRCPEFAK